VLTLTTMLFGDEVLPADRLDELESVTEAEATPRELAMAEQLISTLSADFEPEKYHDEYRERVLELIERKASGETIAAPVAEEEPAAAPDLMAALEASLAAVRSDGGGGGGEAEAEKPAPAPKSTKRTGGSRARASAKADGAGKSPAKAKR
jgi:DNA end-binding protein Ku